jgi:hypothetical protein
MVLARIQEIIRTVDEGNHPGPDGVGPGKGVPDGACPVLENPPGEGCGGQYRPGPDGACPVVGFI